ncbi:YhcN/YlaJ family sporulation lipoprotein [Neobacillus sp. Marseille-QA0830]
MKKPLLGLAFAVSLIGLTACNGDNNTSNNIARNNNNNMNVNTVRKNTQDNGRLRLSTLAERRVERMDEVDDARVIIRNNNAYVAVRLNGNNNNGTAGNLGAAGNRDLNSANLRGGQMNLPDTTGNTGGRNTNTGDQTINNYTGNAGFSTINNTGNTTGQAGTNSINGNNNTTGTNHLNNNNGTGTGANTYSEVSNKLEQRIADRVRSADKSIHKVYVSYDTNFYNQMGDFTNRLNNGRNANGLLDDFGDAVRRFFR